MQRAPHGLTNMRRYTTELRGALLVHDDVGFDLRIVREDDALPRYLILTGSRADEARPFGSLQEAREDIEKSVANGSARVEWCASLEPGEGETACVVCGVGAGRRLEARERHPETLCPACVLEAVDKLGREVRFRTSRRVVGSSRPSSRPEKECKLTNASCGGKNAGPMKPILAASSSFLFERRRR